ncbi:MAG: FG-GAP-like repeat-containing protein [Solirubrobacteraceae bacterium]
MSFRIVRCAVALLAVAALGAPAAARSATLSPALGMRIDGRLWRQHAGIFVAGAGDVNGDGRADVLVGTSETHRLDSPRWNAYVVFGRAGRSGRVVRLDRLGSGGLHIVIDHPPGFLSGAGAGDVNGDGLADIVLATGERGAAVYVIYGRRHGGTVDAGRLGRGGFTIRSVGAEAGATVAGAGDIDRDGFADVLIGVPTYVPPGGEFGTGRASVVFGAHRSGTVDLNHLGTRGAAIVGPGPFHVGNRTFGVGFGQALAGLGDGDVVVGEPYLGGREGGAFVVGGLRRGETVDLRAAHGDWWAITGSGGNAAGFAVSAAGDLNRDGRPDVLVGELAGGGALVSSGGPSAAYVVFGRQTPGDVALGSLGPLGAVLADATSGDRAGQSVAGVGDVTGDGWPDVLVGAPLADPRGVRQAGSAFLVPGPVSGTVDLRHAAGVRRYDGRAAFDTAGWSVAGVGDVNGDRRRDIAIGVPRADPLSSQSGSVYVVYGAPPSRK